MKRRSAARSTLGWVFGLSLSVLFLALWGRAVVVDTDTLAESLSPLARSGFAVDFLSDWLAEEMVSSGADAGVADAATTSMFQGSELDDTLDQLAAEVVVAAASTDPGGSSVDMASLVTPAVPDITIGLNGLGYPTSENEVFAVVSQLDPLVVRSPGGPAIVGPGSPTAARLGVAAVLAFMTLIASGSGYVALSDDRNKAVRDLANRVVLGGLSFAVFLRLGAWVLDPAGGRAPVRQSVAELAGSKWSVPLQVALVAAVFAGVAYLIRRRRRPRPGDGVFDDTEERPMALSR